MSIDDIDLEENDTYAVDDELDTELESNDESVELENVEQNNDDGKHEEDEGYGKKVQKRINKLVAERNITKEENNQLRGRLEQLELRAHDDDSKREADEVGEKISELKRRKLELMDEGSYADAEELNDELLDLKIKQKSNTPAKQVVQEQQSNADTQHNQANQELPEAQANWIADNDWYGKGSKAKSNYANEVYQELVAEGYDPQDEDTYGELDKRLGNTTKKKSNERPPSGNAPNRGSVVGSNSGQTKMTNRDVSMMRDFGLDPNDAGQRKEWLKNKSSKG